MTPVGSHAILGKIPGVLAAYCYWHTEYYAIDEKAVGLALKVGRIIEYSEAVVDFYLKKQKGFSFFVKEMMDIQLESVKAASIGDVQAIRILKFKADCLNVALGMHSSASPPVPPWLFDESGGALQ